LTVVDMQREGQYLRYNVLDSHRTDIQTLKDIVENMTLCVGSGEGTHGPQQQAAWPRPTEVPASRDHGSAPLAPTMANHLNRRDATHSKEENDGY
jgi:hypothetical protein